MTYLLLYCPSATFFLVLRPSATFFANANHKRTMRCFVSVSLPRYIWFGWSASLGHAFRCSKTEMSLSTQLWCGLGNHCREEKETTWMCRRLSGAFSKTFFLPKGAIWIKHKRHLHWCVEEALSFPLPYLQEKHSGQTRRMLIWKCWTPSRYRYEWVSCADLVLRSVKGAGI